MYTFKVRGPLPEVGEEAIMWRRWLKAGIETVGAVMLDMWGGGREEVGLWCGVRPRDDEDQKLEFRL